MCCRLALLLIFLLVLSIPFNGALVAGGRVFGQILDNQRDATVGWIERVAGFLQVLVGETANLRDLILPDAMSLHEAAGGIGAVG